MHVLAVQSIFWFMFVGDLYVEIDQEEYTVQDNTTVRESGVILSSFNKTFSISTPMGTGIEVRRVANNSLLTIVTALLPSYKNNSLGLTGKWNDNIDDDFTLPNGTVLPIDMSESDIFYKFGEQCKFNIINTIHKCFTKFKISFQSIQIITEPTNCYFSLRTFGSINH